MLLPSSGNPLKCHEEDVLFLQLMKHYITTTLFDDILLYNVSVFVWCLYMAINSVNIQCYNGGLLPDIILLTQGYYHNNNNRGTRINVMKRLYLQTMAPPTKRFDIFPSDWEMLRSLDAFRFFFQQHITYNTYQLYITHPSKTHYYLIYSLLSVPC